VQEITRAKIAGPRFPLALPLLQDDVHVIQFALDSHEETADLTSMVDDEERRRMARLVRESDRRRFMVAHALTRLVLGRCLQVSPASLRFDIGPHGKPRLSGARLDLRFNLSHAGERALLGIAMGRELGVDIEKERRVDVLGIARRYFSPSEYLALASMPEEHRVGAFCRCWTRKESFLKARGEGLALALNGFEVSLAETAPRLLVACASAPTELDRWTMVSVPVEAGYAGAITAEGQGWRLTCWNRPVQG
jgi:4'-phosphopantetheinyl transferase